jgi:ribosome biogenesis protein BRX1
LTTEFGLETTRLVTACFTMISTNSETFTDRNDL